MRTERVTFDSDGVELIGELRVPEGVGRGQAVALTGLFTGVKDQVVGTYAERLTEAGIATLAFEHRGFGESGGRPDGMRNFVRGSVAVLGLVSVVIGVCALTSPDSFSEFVNFPPHHHFVHDVGAFQLGLGAAMLLALIWADAAAVALAGYLVGGVAHTALHLADADLGGSLGQTLLIALLSLLAAAALVIRWRELDWLLGNAGRAATAALAPFNRQKTALLTTYRRDGTLVGTPVSIAVDGERAYVRSFERAWKTRRIQRNPIVAVAPSTVRGTPTGPAITATARRLSGPEQKHAARALARKCPLLHGVLVPLMHRVGRAKTGRTVHFELVLRGDGGPDQAGENGTRRLASVA